ncbi:MAG: efflux RND transporter periplasmic adaptor subunit [Propionivibrio sp.]|uniref:Efflux RND transporter periplasmic adaptor subunit n=1 Tax=Candidatus Propionivibrio dominans TaxID=2954373 RepID=A0A9D7FEY8_9RHOO|nr:efflux RND transporter periplasmic adaptor subunit [Candidatus Propionivibrio dominans]
MSEQDLSGLSIDRNRSSSRISRPGRRRWLWAGTFLVLAVIGFALLRLNGAKSVDTVTVTTAYPYQAVTRLNAAGYVVAQRKASVASKATGRLEWLGVAEGSKVREGEVIARLENRDMQAQVDQAAASVTSARVELQDARRALERARDLERQKYVSVSALDSAQARFDKAAAGVGVALANQRAAQVGVDQTLIRAPFDGVVLTKTANVGDVITPFSSATESKGAVVTMADMETLEVEADVSEVNLGKIWIGQPCEIQLDAFPEKRMRGVVSRTVPTVDRAKATVLVKVRFVERDPAVLPEMSAKVAFLDKEVGASERQALTAVHESALAIRDGQSVLFQVVDGKVRMIPVQLGQKINDLVALTVEPSVLKAGDKVVAAPPDNLRDGDRVKTGLKQ